MEPQKNTKTPETRGSPKWYGKDTERGGAGTEGLATADVKNPTKGKVFVKWVKQAPACITKVLTKVLLALPKPHGAHQSSWAYHFHRVDQI